MARRKNQVGERRKYSEIEVQELLEALERSEQSRVKFAREHGVRYSTLCSWLYRARRQGRSSQWVEVTDALKPEAAASSLPYRIHWPNGLALDLSSEFESRKVRELLTIV
jgi:transposase-like protein